MNPEVSVINPLLYPDPAEVLKDSTLRTPLWGQGPTFCTNFQSASDAMRNLGLAVLDAEEPDVLVDMSKRLMMIYLETRHWYVVPNAFQLMRLRNGGKESVTNPVCVPRFCFTGLSSVLNQVEICGLDKLPPFADIYPKVPDSPPVKTQDSSDPTGKLGNVNAMLGDDSLPEPVDISASWNSDSKQWGDSGNTWGDSGDTWGDSGNTWADSGNTWGDKSDAGEGSWGSGHASTGADWSTGSTTVAASGWGGGSETVSADWGDGPANVVSDWGSSTVSKDKTTSSNLNASDWGISTNTQANASGARATSTQNTRRDSSSGIATTGGWGTSDGETETWGSSAPIGSGDGNRVGAVDSWGSPPPRNHTVGVGPQSSAGRVNTASNPEVSSKWGHSRPNSMKSRPAASSHTFSTTHQSKKSRPSTQEGSGWGDDGMTATWNVDSAGGSWGSSW